MASPPKPWETQQGQQQAMAEQQQAAAVAGADPTSAAAAAATNAGAVDAGGPALLLGQTGVSEGLGRKTNMAPLAIAVDHMG